MTLTISSPPSVARQVTRSRTLAASLTEPAGVPIARAIPRAAPSGVRHETTPAMRAERGPGNNQPGLLGRYLDGEGRLRQVVALPGAGGSVLVVDRDATTLCDRRLVAHLAADEPPENAALVCEQYLCDPAGRWCRRVQPGDLEAGPFSEAEEARGSETEGSIGARALVDKHGSAYRLERRSTGMSIPELRWCRYSPLAEGGGSDLVSMRDVVASLESYEPVRTLTSSALVHNCDDPTVSIAVLRGERARLEMSQIVLNRGLRRAVLRAAATQDLSMSEIAARCGRVKHDSKGNGSGETSWLARRLGISPEGGVGAPTPWIHTDVLGLIARCGLGICPREVELG
jgi:hypothetical protein